jgi:hypothetical protein
MTLHMSLKHGLGLVGRKRGMTRVFTDTGETVPVTVIEALPNRITQVKTTENDGYRAIQVAVGNQRASRLSKAVIGHYAKANVAAGEKLLEFRLDGDAGADLVSGGELKVDMFAPGQVVDVTGTTTVSGVRNSIEANNSAALAFMNTFLATAGAVLGWISLEWMIKGKPSMLGAASGAVAGLVAITPAAGNVGVMGALIIGLLAGAVCLWGVSGLKRLLGADDSLDVFGVHGIGGILGALLTGVFNSPALGGPGFVTDWAANPPATGFTSIAEQIIVQAKAVGVTVVWSAVVAYICYKIADMLVGLRVTEEEEREGLDINSHGETAYHS